MDNKIISLDEYLNFRRNYRLIKVDTVKSTIEKYKIGEFSGKSEEEVQKFYEDLTDRLNDMIEHPCGETSFEVSKIITENNINTKDFDIMKDYGKYVTVLHIHDNNGEKDEHKIISHGNIDWDYVAKGLSDKQDIILSSEIKLPNTKTYVKDLKENLQMLNKLDSLVKSKGETYEK